MTANRLGILQLLALFAKGALSPKELMQDCLARIRERDRVVHAWTYLDAVPQLAAAMDGINCGAALRGIPFGVKDVIDVQGMPTICNSRSVSALPRSHDADIVRMLRHHGAIPIGKTETVEFASGGRPAPTRNPHDPAQTPGASSAGSAAAVADFMVPFALGTQSAGSIIRPAVYCGVFGFKPTHGRLSPAGIQPTVPSIETPGWFARSADDLILLARCLGIGVDIQSCGDHLQSRELRDGLRGVRLGLCQTAFWNRADSVGRALLEKAVTGLADAGAEIVPLAMPDGLADLAEAVGWIIGIENGYMLYAHYLSGRRQLSPVFRERVEQALVDDGGRVDRGLTAVLDRAAALRQQHDRLFDGLDGLLTLGAPGVAPPAEQGSGDSIFCCPWSMMHAPAIAIPAGRDPQSGLPFGVQLVGPRHSDARLLQLAGRLALALDVKKEALT